MFEDLQTNSSLVAKPTKYSNPFLGPTEPQRRIIKALASGKGNYLIEVENIKGRKRFRCYDRQQNIVGYSFSPVVVRNLEAKGYLVLYQRKYFLK